MRRLVFENMHTIPSTVELLIDRKSIPHVIEWYASHHAGDHFTVEYNGEPIVLDKNYEMVGK